MELSPVYKQRLAEAREQGVQAERRRTMDTVLRMRFGTVDEELTAVIQPIIDLPSPEYAALLLQLPNISREELLARFLSSDRASGDILFG